MAKRLRSPIRWLGGKGRIVAKLLPLIPPHRIYVEPFGGGANLLLAKEPSLVEVYNDLDSGLVNFFRVLRDEEKFARFYKQVRLTPYSREEFYYCKETWENEEDEVMRAVKWFVLARQNFGGVFGNSWGFAVTASNRGMSDVTSKWLSTIDMLPDICERLLRVEIEHQDFRNIFATYDTEETFFYVDPPYVPQTRRAGQYKHEMTAEDHQDLVDILLHIKGKAMLSGYDNDIYKRLEEHGWVKLTFERTCSTVGRTRNTNLLGDGALKNKQPRTECVWLSPNCETIPLKTQQLELIDES